MYNGWLGPLPSPKKWVFIVGCYNSGTTLLHDLLRYHPYVASMPNEGQYYTDQLLLPKSVGLARLWAIDPTQFYLNENNTTRINVSKLKKQWGAHFNDPTLPVLIEKSPTNAARTRWLQVHFKNSYFIGIIRNGYAVAEGIHRKAGHPLEVAAMQWARSNKIMLQDFEFLHKKKLIRYEELANSPNKVLEGILEFLELDPELLNLEVKNCLLRIHGQVSTIKNMNYRSLDVLSRIDHEIIENKAEEMLNLLGYKK